MVTKSLANNSSSTNRGVVTNDPVMSSPSPRNRDTWKVFGDLVQGVGEHPLVDPPPSLDGYDHVAEPLIGEYDAGSALGASVAGTQRFRPRPA